MTDAPNVSHKHAWKMVAHVDSCHAYRSVYACECGATADTYDERSPEGYGQVWMRDDDGSPMCPRCAELLNGDLPADSERPDGWPKRCHACGAHWSFVGYDHALGFNCRACGGADSDE